MNMKYLAILVSACLVGLVGMSGCVVVGTDGDTLGVGGGTTSEGTGATGDTTGGSGGTSSTGGSTTGGTGGSGGSTGPTCVSCAEFVTPGLNPDMLPVCDGTSSDLYKALVDCTCTGACADACGDNVCMEMDATDACVSCIQDTVAGCGNEFGECSNDAG